MMILYNDLFVCNIRLKYVFFSSSFFLLHTHTQKHTQTLLYTPRHTYIHKHTTHVHTQITHIHTTQEQRQNAHTYTQTYVSRHRIHTYIHTHTDT